MTSYDYRERKIVAVLASTLTTGPALNVLGHLALALGAHARDGLMGRPRLPDASGVQHVGIARYPLIVTSVRPARLRRFIHDVRNEGSLFLVDYPQQMLTTGHDDELAGALQGASEESIVYLGAIVYGETGTVDSLTSKFSLWQ